MASFCLITLDSTRQLGIEWHPDWSTALGEWDVTGNQLAKHVHDGNNRNFEALLTTDAATGRTIIIETNQSDHVYTLADAINAILDGKPYTALSAMKGQ